jgi:S1-C subfamily serine protease
VIFGAGVGDTIGLTLEREGKLFTVKLLLAESPEE